MAKTKAELTAEAEALGIEIPEGATVKQIEALIAGEQPAVKENPAFEEFNCRILPGRKAKVLELKHKRRLITREQADTLNVGAVDGGNAYASMYFPAGEQKIGDEVKF